MVVLDCETVAIAGARDLFEPVSAPANYRDPEKIAAYVADAERRQVESAGLYPWTARIIALGWCEEGSEVPVVRLCNAEASEATALTEFWALVNDGRSLQPVVTFNGRRFDLPLIMARSRLLDVKAPVLSLDRYRSPHPDLLDILTWQGTIEARSLRWYAKRFGLDTSDAFSGREVAGLVEDGNWDAVRTHCASDVTLTRQLAERLGVMRAPVFQWG